MKKLLLSCLLALGIQFSGYSQITIAPTNLFIEDGSRFGTYMVINNSNENQEISIEFVFSYSLLNEQGERSIVENDSIRAAEHSVADYIRAFPQSFVLNPGQRQVVRLRVTAPSDLSDGTYWARIKTKASPETPPVELEQTETVTASLGLIVEQVTGLYYKKGAVTTGVQVENIRTQLSEDEQTLIVMTDFKRGGNSPFLGSITTSLVDAGGTTVRQRRTSTTLYFDGTHSQALDISDLESGNYTIRVHFETQRSDVPQEDIVQMRPVTQTTSYTLR